MNMEKNFKALIVDEVAPGVFTRAIKPQRLDDLPDHELLVRVHYSSLNYKDALSASGNKAITRQYPHTPGIDAAGVVCRSHCDDFQPGDEVIVNGKGLGTMIPGGFGQYIRVPSAWAAKRPRTLSLRDSMIYGVAGFTAAYSVLKLQKEITPDQGAVLVTGATGGVGSVAVAILKKEGYSVIAATGKPQEKEFLVNLGAAEVISSNELKKTEKPLCSSRWMGVVDTVGGDLLATAIKGTSPNGVVTCCGNAAGPQLSLTVYPFILRGVSLLGIDCVSCPAEIRKLLWNNLAGKWKLDNLEQLVTEVDLEGLENRIEKMLAGQVKGRTIVNMT